MIKNFYCLVYKALFIIICLHLTSCDDGTIEAPNNEERDFTKISKVPATPVNLNDQNGTFVIEFAWNINFTFDAYIRIYNYGHSCTGIFKQIADNGTKSSSSGHEYTFNISEFELSCLYSGEYKISGYFVNVSTNQTYDFDNIETILTNYTQPNTDVFLQKARGMKIGNPRFYEPPHPFNGWHTNNLNNSGSVGWSYNFRLPSISIYNSRLNNALSSNPSNWLGYNCPGNNENSGFPYTFDDGNFYNNYNYINCNVGFACFAFVYEAARQAGINILAVSEAGQYITQYGSIPINQRRVGDLVLYNLDRSNNQNQSANDFSDHVAIITEVSTVNPKLDKVISCFGAHEYFKYGVYECKLWDFHSTSNNTPGIFLTPSNGGYWLDEYNQWDESNIRIVRVIN